MLHTSSLLYTFLILVTLTFVRIDDIEDGSVIRRGFPAAHIKFGIPQTINAANYIYFSALHELETLKNPEVIRIYCGTNCVTFDQI